MSISANVQEKLNSSEKSQGSHESPMPPQVDATIRVIKVPRTSVFFSSVRSAYTLSVFSMTNSSGNKVCWISDCAHFPSDTLNTVDDAHSFIAIIACDGLIHNKEMQIVGSLITVDCGCFEPLEPS